MLGILTSLSAFLAILWAIYVHRLARENRELILQFGKQLDMLLPVIEGVSSLLRAANKANGLQWLMDKYRSDDAELTSIAKKILSLPEGSIERKRAVQEYDDRVKFMCREIEVAMEKQDKGDK